VISLKKYLDSKEAFLETSSGLPVPDTLSAALSAYGSALAEMGNCSLEVCPGIGGELKQHFMKIRTSLSPQISSAKLSSAGVEVDEHLRSWSRSAARHYLEKAREVKDLLMVMAHTADSVGTRDERCAGQLREVTARLGAIAIHLVLPHDSLFREEERPAKASVVLKLRHGSLADGEPEAIRNLVASAVDGLTPDHVVLVDADGRYPLGPKTPEGLQLSAEQSLEDKLVATLEPVTGVGNVRASVALDYDPSATETTQEIYDPTQTVTLSMQRSQQAAGPQPVAAGVPGTASNAPNTQALPVYPQQNSQPQTASSESGTYATSKTVKHMVEGPGRLRRMTAAIVVNDRQVAPALKNKAAVWQPRSADELRQLTALAQTAVGFDSTRGDALTVEDLAFDQNRPQPVAPLPTRVLSAAEGSPLLVKYAALLIGLLAVLALGVRPAVRHAASVLLEAGKSKPRELSNFTQSANGSIVTAAGLNVMGYPAVNGVVNTDAPLVPISIPVGEVQEPQATSSFSTDANLDAASPVGTQFPSQLTVYDSLGEPHVATITYTQTAPNTWCYSAALPAGDFASGVSTPVTGTLGFDTNGNLTTVTPTGGTASPVGTTAGDVSSIPLAFTGLSDTASNLNMQWNLVGPNGTPTISQVDTDSAVSSTIQNGYPSGQYQSFSIGGDGTVTVSYSNGQLQNVGQVALANVDNLQGLQLLGDGNYATTLASGTASIGTSGTSGLASLQDGALEASNVNISAEFSNLIIAQRAFEANAKSVTTFDTVTQDTINMVH
jgi:flagellar hook protein FlgE